MWYMYTTENYLAIRNEIMPFVETEMTLIEMIILSQTEETNILWYHSYVGYDFKKTNELIHKTETDLQIWKINLWLQKRKCEGVEE